MNHIKPKALRDRDYLDYLKTETCILSGVGATESLAIDPAHIGTAGKGLKSPDNEALPIRHDIHAAMHQRGEMTVFRKMAPDWLLRVAFRAYARELYEQWKST
jgi:hypothetical protein